MPTLFLLFDLLYLSPPWTITAAPAIGIYSGIAFCYWFWLEKCYSMNGWCVFHEFAFQIIVNGKKVPLSFDGVARHKGTHRALLRRHAVNVDEHDHTEMAVWPGQWVRTSRKVDGAGWRFQKGRFPQ